MNLVNITLSEKATHKRASTTGFHLHKGHRVVKFIKRENKMMVSKGLEEGLIESYCSLGTKFSLGR